jgi:hypothetical protein
VHKVALVGVVITAVTDAEATALSAMGELRAEEVEIFDEGDGWATTSSGEGGLSSLGGKGR